MVGRVVDAMGEINTSSKKVVDITSVIDSIALQTNILALNAAVEAALVEELAAAAGSLQTQATVLVGLVGTFRLSGKELTFQHGASAERWVSTCCRDALQAEFGFGPLTFGVDQADQGHAHAADDGRCFHERIAL